MHAPSCPSLCNPWTLSCQTPVVHEIFQVRIPGWVAISYSRASSQHRDQTHVSCISCTGRQIFTPVSPGKPFDIFLYKIPTMWLRNKNIKVCFQIKISFIKFFVEQKFPKQEIKLQFVFHQFGIFSFKLFWMEFPLKF